jgi:hypothetical protein
VTGDVDWAANAPVGKRRAAARTMRLMERFTGRYVLSRGYRGRLYVRTYTRSGAVGDALTSA